MNLNAFFASAALGVVALATPAPAQSIGDTPGVKIGVWEVETLKDGFSDNVRGIGHTPIKNGGIVVKCDTPGDGSLYISFITPEYLGDDSVGSRYRFHQAKYRLDDGPPAALSSPYYNRRSASLLGKKDAGNFLRELIAANPKRLRAQFVTYDSQFVDIDIDITGVADAIRETATICRDSAFASTPQGE